MSTSPQNDHNESPEEDIVYEEEESSGGSFGRSKKEEKLKDKLALCQKERQEYLEGWQRTKADLINARKEFDVERQKIRKFATEDLIEDLLSVLDSFEMAMKNKDMWQSLDETWRQGMEHIYRELTERLSVHGLEPLEPTGEPFDPAQHESVAKRDPEKKEQEGSVAEVVQKGYAIRSKVLRAPKVVVYQTD